MPPLFPNRVWDGVPACTLGIRSMPIAHAGLYPRPPRPPPPPRWSLRDLEFIDS